MDIDKLLGRLSDAELAELKRRLLMEPESVVDSYVRTAPLYWQSIIGIAAAFAPDWRHLVARAVLDYIHREQERRMVTA